MGTIIFAAVAQLVEQLISNHQVGGSNPSSSTITALDSMIQKTKLPIQSSSDYNIHWAKGTGGSFLVNCFQYYLYPEYFKKISLSETGDAHPKVEDLSDDAPILRHSFHHTWFIDVGSHETYIVHPNRYNIFVKCSSEKYDIVAEMFLYKVLQYDINRSTFNRLAGSDWADYDNWIDDELTRKEIKSFWKSSLVDWMAQAQFNNADLIVDFEDIHFDKNLNSKISELCNQSPSVIVDNYINCYREKNKRYWK